MYFTSATCAEEARAQHKDSAQSLKAHKHAKANHLTFAFLVLGIEMNSTICRG